MKILWVNSGFLHLTNRGGQIRTLGMLQQFHKRHEVHYVAFADSEEGIRRSSEYCMRSYVVPHSVPNRGSVAFNLHAVGNLFSSLPLAVARYQSIEMRKVITDLRASEQFDAVICDFLFPSGNFVDLSKVVLFQHNFETAIWRRHAETATGIAKTYFGTQARRMFSYEREVCRKVAQVVAVSPVDAEQMRSQFGIQNVADIATGVDIDYFAPPASAEASADLVFLGSMDWMANIDGVEYFVERIFPLISARKPDCTLAIVGRRPPAKIEQLAEKNPRIHVTGTVPDVRPYMWGAGVSIVPLRIGSGTRLKIYEAMASRVPVVSTSIGAEGLECKPPNDIRIADDPHAFAQECLDLLDDEAARRRVGNAGWELVSSRFSWDQVTRQMEALLPRGL